jgi:hypothetical protein
LVCPESMLVSLVAHRVVERRTARLEAEKCVGKIALIVGSASRNARARSYSEKEKEKENEKEKDQDEEQARARPSACHCACIFFLLARCARAFGLGPSCVRHRFGLPAFGLF